MVGYWCRVGSLALTHTHSDIALKRRTLLGIFLLFLLLMAVNVSSLLRMFSRLFCALPLCSALNGGRAGLLISLFATRVLCITLYENVSGYGCSAGTIGTDVAGVVVTVGEGCDGWLG